jgi:hypothetical protein
MVGWSAVPTWRKKNLAHTTVFLALLIAVLPVGQNGAPAANLVVAAHKNELEWWLLIQSMVAKFVLHSRKNVHVAQFRARLTAL